MLIHSAVITGSVQLNNTDVSSITNVAGFATTSSVNALSSSIVSVVKSKMDTDGVVSGSSQLTSSFDTRYVLSGSITQTTWDNIANKPAGIVSSSAQIIELGFATTASVNDLQSKTGSYATTASFDAYTGSNDTINTTQNTRLSTIESVTGSYATTGSNTFIGTQTFTGSVFITSDLVVQGSSSLQNITASAVSIGTNTVILNTDSPAVRFAGISVVDSGSTSAVTSSLWYDSLNEKWIYQKESGSTYSGGMLISGPRNTGSLGNEEGMANNYVAKGLGGDHIGPSIIFESASINIGIGTITPIAKLDVAGTSKFGTTTADTHQFTGSVLMSGSLSVVTTGTELQVNAGGVNIGNALTDNHIISGSFGINTNALFVSSSGNTGLGVINPASRLHVIGDITQQTSLNASAQFFLILRKSRGTVDTPLTVNVNDEAGGILFTGYDGTTWRNGAAIRAKVQSVTTGTLSSNLEFFAGNGAPSVGTQVLTMRGDTQNVGIGTTSPNNRLEIRNDVNGDLAFWINNRAVTASGTSNSIIFGGYRDAEEAYAVGKISVIHVGGSSGDLNHAGDMVFYTQRANPSTLGERMRITSAGTVQPGANGTQDLGTSSLRWATIYTSDLSLSNGIGDYTIVEGENDLFLYNNKQNKVYKFLLAEVDPADATPKKS
jgi:hypothetical protein